MKRLLFLSLLFTSCGNLYKVSTEENSGIPFFKQEVVETETITYRESFFRIELSREYEEVQEKEMTKPKTKKNSKTPVPTKTKKTFNTKIVRFGTLDCGFEINSKFNSATTTDQAEKAIYDPLIGVPSTANIGSNCTFKDSMFNYLTISEIINPIDNKHDSKDNQGLKLSLISNIKSRSVKPSPQSHYININKSITGSTSATITLNENGTLASAASTVQEDLVGKLIDKIPLTDIILSELNILDGAEEQSLGTDEMYKLVSISLKLIPVHRDYIISNDSYFKKDGIKIDNDVSATNFTSFKIKESEGKILINVEEKKDDKGETISLSGKITMPKKEK